MGKNEYTEVYPYHRSHPNKKKNRVRTAITALILAGAVDTANSLINKTDTTRQKEESGESVSMPNIRTLTGIDYSLVEVKQLMEDGKLLMARNELLRLTKRIEESNFSQEEKMPLYKEIQNRAERIREKAVHPMEDHTKRTQNENVIETLLDGEDPRNHRKSSTQEKVNKATLRTAQQMIYDCLDFLDPLVPIKGIDGSPLKDKTTE